MSSRYSFLGIKFDDISFKDLYKQLIRNGGLVLIPSGPGLASLNSEKNYHHALMDGDFVIFDSGYFCLLLRFIKKINVKKFSGYKFLKSFLNKRRYKKDLNFFLVEPNSDIAKINFNYFKKNNLFLNIGDQYISPIYNKENIYDDHLLRIIMKKKPKIILINLGGGIQEILGSYLKKNLEYKPIIICSGAAISFLTKQQANISPIVDKLYIGWLNRIFFNPKEYIGRYIKALKLIKLVLRNRMDKIK